MESAAKWLKKTLDYEFDDATLLRFAFTHRSVSGGNNERLEFLGDSILNFVIAEAVFTARPDAPEGILSRLRASLVKDKTLAKLAGQLGMGEFLILGPGELKAGGHRRASILADALEALFGSILSDGGVDEARRVILLVYAELLEYLPDEVAAKDAKTRLQELLQARQLPLPDYELVIVSGPPHEQVFQVACKVSGIDEPTSGEGSTRRIAEQKAAGRMLDLLHALKAK